MEGCYVKNAVLIGVACVALAGCNSGGRNQDTVRPLAEQQESSAGAGGSVSFFPVDVDTTRLGACDVVMHPGDTSVAVMRDGKPVRTPVKGEGGKLGDLRLDVVEIAKWSGQLPLDCQ